MKENFNITVLVAPLDWGLGHATRCIPLVRYLMDKGCKIILAAEGAQKSLLEKEFPTVEILNLSGYRIKYSVVKRLFAIKIIQQLPTIIHTITTEHQWLKKVVNEYNVDAVISDNRYGLYNHNIHSIFITHQLQVHAPFGWLRSLLRRMNFSYINKFNECWVPDEEGQQNIAGALSHPRSLPNIPVKYLGPVSRLNKQPGVEIVYDFIAIISGPEPQRSILEEKILKQVQHFKGTGLVVRGLPSSLQPTQLIGSVKVVSHMVAEELEKAMNESEFIIGRSGYTTVMDIIKLEKKSILIPTPGQTEQEYLADHLFKQQWCVAASQESFELNNLLEAAREFDYKLPNLNMDKYKTLLDEFLQSVQLKKNR